MALTATDEINIASPGADEAALSAAITALVDLDATMISAGGGALLLEPNALGLSDDQLMNRRAINDAFPDRQLAIAMGIDRADAGYAVLDGSSQYFNNADAGTPFAPGLYSATVLCWAWPTADGYLVATRAPAGLGGFSLRILRSDDTVQCRLGDASVFAPFTTPAYVMDDGPILAALVIDRASNEARFYLQDELIETASVAALGSIGQSTNLNIGRDGGGTNYAAALLYGFAYLNVALTGDEVAQVARNPSLLRRNRWAGALGSTATSGTLTAGKAYRINTFVAGDDFTNIGAASNATGVIFVATGATPTTWANGSTVEQVGLKCLALAGPSNELSMADISGNGRHLAANGSPPFVSAHIPRRSKRQISADTTILESDHGKRILVTAGCTVTLPTTLSRGWAATFVFTASSGTLTFSGTLNTISGTVTVTSRYRHVEIWHDGSGVFYGSGF